MHPGLSHGVRNGMASASQLYLLADHIKLSLLERQRAISLNLEPNSQDGHISRSLDSFREGIEALEQQQRQLAGSDSSYHLQRPPRPNPSTPNPVRRPYLPIPRFPLRIRSIDNST
ncbi:MAG: hypothetical protein Q9179_006030 [Wetmoreana sp. 5 TL-2023]